MPLWEWIIIIGDELASCNIKVAIWNTELKGEKKSHLNKNQSPFKNKISKNIFFCTVGVLKTVPSVYTLIINTIYLSHSKHVANIVTKVTKYSYFIFFISFALEKEKYKYKYTRTRNKVSWC